ncbi:MAG: NifU family protein [Synergistaceae bacterium]|jgi:Fe-S cluster biogenesis protein NfuA|nr:NifU family protein [Synergistaceae bacterium]
MSEVEVIEKIKGVVDSEIRPMLESHGGGIDLVGFDAAKGVLSVQLTGGCCGCPGAQATLSNMVERVVQRTVPEVREVVRA